MEESNQQLLSPLTVFGELQKTLNEQAGASTRLSESVQALANHLTN